MMPLSWEASDGGNGARATPVNGNGHLLNNTMDNAAFDGNGEVPARPGNGRNPRGVATATVELGEFAPTRTSVSSVPQVVVLGGGGAPVGSPSAPLCKPDLCRSMMPAAAKPPAMRPNPWHRHKTVLLVGTVVGLVVWAVAYLVLQYYEVLV